MTWRTITLALAAALVVAACADASVSGSDADDAPGTTGSTTTAPEDPPEPGPSTGTEPNGDWVLTDGIDAVPGYPITLGIDGTTIGGTAACNGYGGSIEIGDDLWSIGDLAVTQMACEPSVMDSESAFFTALADVDGWRLEDGALILTGPDPELIFERMPEVPTEALVDTEWVLETLVQGDMAFTTVGEPATLRLHADGTVSGSTGCRELSGSWVIRNGQVVFPEFAADGECPDDVVDQDNIVVTVLGDGFAASVDGDLLTLTSMGNEGLVYRAA